MTTLFFFLFVVRAPRQQPMFKSGTVKSKKFTNRAVLNFTYFICIFKKMISDIKFSLHKYLNHTSFMVLNIYLRNINTIIYTIIITLIFGITKSYFLHWTKSDFENLLYSFNFKILLHLIIFLKYFKIIHKNLQIVYE